jgi:hypothetical protein
VIYKRGVLHGDTCESLSVPSEFNIPEASLGLLAVLTDNYNTSYELLEATQRQQASVNSVCYKALFDRLDNDATEGLGLLWFENVKEDATFKNNAATSRNDHDYFDVPTFLKNKN